MDSYDFSPTMGSDSGWPPLGDHTTSTNPQYQYVPDQPNADSGYPSYTDELVDSFNDSLSNFCWTYHDPHFGYSEPSSNSLDPVLLAPVHSMDDTQVGTLLPEFQQQAQHDSAHVTTTLLEPSAAKETRLHFCQPHEYSSFPTP